MQIPPKGKTSSQASQLLKTENHQEDQGIQPHKKHVKKKKKRKEKMQNKELILKTGLKPARVTFKKRIKQPEENKNQEHPK